MSQKSVFARDLVFQKKTFLNIQIVASIIALSLLNIFFETCLGVILVHLFSTQSIIPFSFIFAD
ncbi:hypothetical protein HOF65_08325 [bacterium]|nr:hypothetical protein [bacterium]